MSLTYNELLESILDDIRGWIARVKKTGGEVGEIDIVAYLAKHWPHAPDSAKASIVKTLMGR